jgi:hypothetical protein
VFSRRACYEATPGLRIRPVPEMRLCFVFTPARPKLYTLNTTAWLVLTLCDGRRGDNLIAAYVSALSGTVEVAQAQKEVRAAIDDLLSKGIVARVEGRNEVEFTTDSKGERHEQA